MLMPTQVEFLSVLNHFISSKIAFGTLGNTQKNKKAKKNLNKTNKCQKQYHNLFKKYTPQCFFNL